MRGSVYYWLGFLLVFAVLGSCDAIIEEFTPVPEPKHERVHLPSKCAHLYNVGRSREWQDCMHVGPK